MSLLIKTIATGKYLPEAIITNSDLEKMVETSDEWITSRTGIKERRKSEVSVAEMAYLAALDTIEKGKYNKDEIDLIIVATITNEYKSPSIANFVQAKLGLNGNKIMAFDINAACTGFVYALEVASSLLASNKYRSALIIGSEKMTRIVDYTDRNTCILFGDGAGAMLIEPSTNSNNEVFFYNDSKGDDTGILTVENHVAMNGPRVYQFAIDVIPKAINEVLLNANLTLDDIDVFIPHQANLRIIESMVNTLQIPNEKVFINIDSYGNTSAASIPIALAEYQEQVNENSNTKLKNVLLVGFGGGFTWGAAIIKI